MMEFRWLDAPMLVSDEPLTEGMSASMPRRKVLQRREGRYVKTQDGDTYWIGEVWSDIPTVLYEQTLGK